ncbi:MAG: GNAT family N-acetyltransferase [Lachnospiraceae bacterium]|mgnify:FL=1|nr:GNAT family N-acetyltransferase [Lachnospiraceae bacterium]
MKKRELYAAKIADQVVLQNDVLQPQDFVRLRVLTGFADIPIEHAKRALDGGLINVSAKYGDRLIGMGRMVGDGAMYWYLQEIIVLPEYQKQGVGTKIVNHLVDYAVSHSTTGKFTTIGGVSAKGKEEFYRKLGFEVISNGIQKMIEIS